VIEQSVEPPVIGNVSVSELVSQPLRHGTGVLAVTQTIQNSVGQVLRGAVLATSRAHGLNDLTGGVIRQGLALYSNPRDRHVLQELLLGLQSEYESTGPNCCD
jgi:hypothetical protein